MTRRFVAALQRERAVGFKNLSGTHLDVTVPITQRLLDVLLERAARARQLGGVTVTLRGAGVIGVAVVKPVLGFAARLGLDLRLRGASDLASDPRLYLLVERPSVTWSAISRIVLAAGLAPAGVEIGRDGVALDLRTLATRAGTEDLLPIARAVTFDGEPGLLRARVTLHVPEGGVAGEGVRPAPAVPRATEGVPGELAELLPELRGARLRGRMVVTEALVNEVVGAALDTARDAPPGGDGQPTAGGGGRRAAARPLPVDLRAVAHWIQRASVRFENGRVVLEPDVEIG